MLASSIAMTLLILAGLGVFGWTASRRWKLMQVAGRPAQRSDNPAQRWKAVLLYMFGQARMFRYPGAGIAHAFIFGGFVVLLIRALSFFARGYAGIDSGFGFWILDDETTLGKIYLFLKDIVGVLVLVGVAYFFYVRVRVKPKRIEQSPEALGILGMIALVIISDLLYEAGGYARVDGAVPFHAATPAASVLALALAPLPSGLATVLYYSGFWLHAIVILTFLNFLPYGKHFHVLTVLPNVYFSSLRGIGRLNRLDDIEGKLEREETLGVKTARDFSWKDVLDFYTCTECGRCSDQCPATMTGKLLSPKHLTLHWRDHMYRNEPALARAGAAGGGNGDGAPAGAAGAEGPAECEAQPLFVLPDGQPDESGGVLAGTWVSPEALWACTTCGACEQECPVFISYIDKIVDMRRNLVMEQGEFPQQLQNAFRGLESVGNVYSFANEQRADWAEGLDVPLISDRPDAEYLYWVGCAPSFDDRSRKIARATVQLLKEAGVGFAILGPEEQCTGDPARRAGNEYLFQMLAQANIETLKGYNVRKIVTTCPHCFSTIRNDYADLGARFEVIHHTELLADLVRAGRLRPVHRVETTLAYHDACYLGRHNGVYDPPREILRSIPGVKLAEPVESRDRGMCCGAGGAQMWKEEEPVARPGGRAGDGKVNHARARQLLNVLPAGGAGSGGRSVATACPFCMTMITDGMVDQGQDDVVPRDVAEILLDSVRGPNA